MFVLAHQFAKLISAEEVAARTEYATVCTSGIGTGTFQIGSGSDTDEGPGDGC